MNNNKEKGNTKMKTMNMIKKIAAVAIAAFTFAFAPSAEAAWSGCVATSNPYTTTIGGKTYYRIATPEDLAWFAAQVNSGNTGINGILVADLYFGQDDGDILASGNKNWTPIGNTPSTAFTGTLDGDGHSIYGLYYNGKNVDVMGVVGYLGQGGLVQRLAAVNSSYFETDHTSATSAKCGAIVAQNNGGTVFDCVTLTFNANLAVPAGQPGPVDYVGGIVGWNASGTIERCYATGSCTGYYVGGIAGRNGTDGTIKDCTSSIGVRVSASTSCSDAQTGYGGGIVGRNWGTCEYCVYMGGKVVKHEGNSVKLGAVVGGNGGASPEGTETGSGVISTVWHASSYTTYTTDPVGENSGKVTDVVEIDGCNVTSDSVLEALYKHVSDVFVFGENGITTCFGMNAEENADLASGGKVYVHLYVNDYTMGRVTGGGAYTRGGSVTVEAIPNDGYLFVGWSDPTLVPSARGSFTINNHTELVAYFESSAPKYDVAIASGITGGKVTADKAKAAENDTVTLTATPEEDYALNAIKVTKTGSDELIDVTDNTFVMPAGAVTVTATFAETFTELIPSAPTQVANTTYTVYTKGVESADGKVWSNRKAFVVYTTADGYYFADGSTVLTNELDTTKNPAVNVTTPAAPQQTMPITVGQATGGTVAVSKALAAKGETVTLTITSDSGYAYGTDDVKVCKTGDEATTVEVKDNAFVMPAFPVTVSVAFKNGVSYRYAVYNNPNDLKGGIKEWKTGVCTTCTAVADSSSTAEVTWGTADAETWYVVNGAKTISGRIVCKGDVHLILADGATLNADTGITASTNITGYSSFTIYAQSEGASMGVLKAKGGATTTGSSFGMGYGLSFGMTSGVTGAAIGGNDRRAASTYPVAAEFPACVGCNITINGGKIEADGGSNGAGIGGHHITINGGTVTATSSSAEGIGNSYITINGGDVTATSTGGHAAGIGNKYITINDGTVKATAESAFGGAGIGGSNGTLSEGEYITINGGDVTATSAGGAGIGSGAGGYETGPSRWTSSGWVASTINLKSGVGRNITITGGKVKATGTHGAGIGSGGGTSGTGETWTSYVSSDITISGGTVIATSTDSSGIGGRAVERLTISGGTVEASGGTGSSGIGTYTTTDGYVSKDVYVAAELGVKADGDNPPMTVIAHETGDDIARVLDGKQYVKIVPTYAIAVDAGITGGTVTADKARQLEDETVTLTVTTVDGYELTGLTVAKTDDPSTTVTVTDNQFTMPGYAVTVSATFKALGYGVTFAAIAHGTVTTDWTEKVPEGETVTLTATPEAGYAFDTLEVYKADDPTTKVTVTEGAFTMPAYTVMVSATFVAVDQAITKAEMTHGTVEVPANAKTGALVTLTVTPDEGCVLDTITVTAANGDALELDENNAFVMPAGGVTISATFRELLAITDVKAQQRYPWNGKVDIAYTVKGVAEGGETLTVVASNTVDGTVYTATSAALIGTPDLTPGTHALVWDLDAQGLQVKTSSILFGLTVSGGMQNLMANGALEVKRGGWYGDGMRSNGMINTDASSLNSVYNSTLYTWYTGAANGLFKLNANSIYVYTFVDPDPATTAWTSKNGFLQADARVFTNLETKESATVMMGTTTKSESAIKADYDKNKAWATTGWNTSDKQKAGFDGVGWYDTTTKRTVMIFTTGNEDSYLGLNYKMNGGNGLATASDEIRAAMVESIMNGELYRLGDSDGTKTAQALREAGIADVLTSDQPSAGSAGEILSVYSDEVAVDTLGGSREAAASETIRFSPAWETEEAGATAVVTIDGVEASKSAETGAYVWTPKPKLGGLVEMTHQVFIGGVQTGATLTASFTVPEPPSYNTTIAAVEHGKVTADRTEKILEGEKVTLTATPDDGYALRMITVTGANDEAIALDEDNAFIMPVGGVKIAATFADARFEGKVRLEPNSTYIYSMTVPENVWNAADGEFLQALVRLYTGDGCALAFASALTGEGTTTASSTGFSAKSEMAVEKDLRKTTITFKTGNAASYAAFSADSVGADFGKPDSDKRAAAQRALKFATLAKATVSSGGTVKVGGDNILSPSTFELKPGAWHESGPERKSSAAWDVAYYSSVCTSSKDGLIPLEPNSEYTYTFVLPSEVFDCNPDETWVISRGQYCQVMVRVYTENDPANFCAIMLASRPPEQKKATDPCVTGYVYEKDDAGNSVYQNGNGYNTGSGRSRGYNAEAYMTYRDDGSVETKIVMTTGADGGKLGINIFSVGIGFGGYATDANLSHMRLAVTEAFPNSTLVMTPKDAEVEVATETESTFACGEDLGDASVTSTETWLTGFDIGAGLWSDASATLLTEEDAYSTDGVALFTPQATQSETPAYVKEILGIAADAALTTDVTESDDTNKIAVAAANVNVETSGDLFDVSFALDKVNADGSPIATNIAESLKNDGLSVDLTKDDPTGYYRSRVIVQQRNGNFRKEVPAENIVGVIKQTQAVTNAIVSVPWANIAPGEDQDIPVSKILKTDNLSDEDEIRVYAPGSSTYKSYTLKNGVWGGHNTLQVGGIGKAAIKAAQSSDEVTLPRGSALWLIRKNPDKPYYLCGQSNGTDESKVEVVRGPNLIGATGTTNYYFNVHIQNAEPGDTIMVPVEGGAPKRFEFKDGSWGYMKGTVVEYKIGTRTVKAVKNTWTTNESFVPAGTGFWLHNNSGKITVK